MTYTDTRVGHNPQFVEIVAPKIEHYVTDLLTNMYVQLAKIEMRLVNNWKQIRMELPKLAIR